MTMTMEVAKVIDDMQFTKFTSEETAPAQNVKRDAEKIIKRNEGEEEGGRALSISSNFLKLISAMKESPPSLPKDIL